MRALTRLLAAAWLLLFLDLVTARAAEPLVLIVHPDVVVASLNKNDVVNIFMGRYRKFPSGARADPIDTKENKEQFYLTLVNRTLAEINSYWARLTFSGRTSPPQQLTESEAIDWVARTPGAIAYVTRSRADKRVQIVHELPQ